ncbi:MAG: tetratricopeptide repeat protein [Phycisphaeraceae bacterium]
MTSANAQDLEALERRVADDPASLAGRVELAEAYLHAAELDRSLAQWQAVLNLDPDHPRAKRVVGRLTAQTVDLDRYLDVLGQLIENGGGDGLSSALDTAARRALADEQQAQIVYLRGRLAETQGDAVGAQAHYRAAMQLYPATPWAGRSAIHLARGIAERTGRTDEAQRLLRQVIDDRAQPQVVREQAGLERYRLQQTELNPAQSLAAIDALIARLETDVGKRRALREQMTATTRLSGRWTPRTLDAAEALLKLDPTFADARDLLRQLLEVAQTSEDRATLDRLIALIDAVVFDDVVLKRESSFVRVETSLARAVVEPDALAMPGHVAEARRVLAGLAQQNNDFADTHRVRALLGRSHLIEAQKLATLADAARALPPLLEAREHYLVMLAEDSDPAHRQLNKIGALLEHLGEAEMAADLYDQVARRFPHTTYGRDALLELARVHAGPLNDPMGALTLYARYSACYPAELTYRQLAVGSRLRRLGYQNVLDFQERNNLKPDGVFSGKTQARLDELEASFDLIHASSRADAGLIRGEFVHPAMYAIADELNKAGRHHDAIIAYRLLLNLFPTKREADDALLKIARLFRDNLLFEEALGAYRQMMADYPKGDKTSQAYVEAAQCLENLGRWSEAHELYELYTRKFPKYEHVALCKARMQLLDEIRQYEQFIEENPGHPKLAEARYQIAAILYKRFENYTKAAIQFQQVADNHAEHVRAADALYSGGTAQLKAENFPAARRAFGELVERYGDSRLADDAQYWIGHTYEYRARAMGKLDAKRIVLKRRSLSARERIAADRELRRFYNPAELPGVAPNDDAWAGDTLGVLADGSTRDRVNRDLLRAIEAYDKVVDDFKVGDMAGPALLRIGKIYTDYLDDPDKGIVAYQRLLANYPGSKEAVDALYRVGEYQLEQEQYDEAVGSFQKFIYNYPNEDKVQDAMLAIARSHAAGKAWAKALDAYQSYLNKFPKGRHADTAQAQVQWIRTYHF